MPAQVGQVDHPVVAVRDLHTTAQRYRKLGFVVPPSGQHQQWGTANLCIMFARDYLEIRGIADAHKFLAGVDTFLENGEGLYSVAFHTADADASYAEGLASGVDIAPPRQLHRKLALPDEDGGRVLDLHFKTVMLGPAMHPGLTHANLCEHLSAQTLRQPGWLDHPNGATGFLRLTGVVDDFDAAAQTYTLLLGEGRVQRQPRRILLTFEQGSDIELIDQAQAQERGIAQSARGSAYLASATLGVCDLQAAHALLLANGVRVQAVQLDGAHCLHIHPDDACGAHWYWRQDEAA